MNFQTREMKFSSSWRGIRVIRVRVNRVKITEKWGEIHAGEIGLSSSYRGSTVVVNIKDRLKLCC